MILISTVAGATTARAATFNLANDFQNAVFSYGFETRLGGTFTPYGVIDTTSRPGITALLEAGSFPANPPYVAYNGTDAPYDLGFIILPPDTLDMHPGPNGEFTVVRFTAGTAGSYDITGLFSGLDTTRADIHVLLNGSALFTGAINGKGDTAPFAPVPTVSTTEDL